MIDSVLLWLLDYFEPRTLGGVLALVFVLPIAAFVVYDIWTHWDD